MGAKDLLCGAVEVAAGVAVVAVVVVGVVGVVDFRHRDRLLHRSKYL